MKEPVHVFYCLDNAGIGGTELNAVRTAERLVERGYTLEVASLSRHPDLIARYERAGVPVHVFPMPSLLSAEALRQGARLRSLLRKRNPQVFHAHDVYGNLFGVPCARMAGVPVVLASRRWWKKELRPGHAFANRIAYRLAHAVVANSPRVAEEAKRDAGGGTPVVLVQNYVDDTAFDDLEPDVRKGLLEDLRVPADRTVVGCVANLRPVKDHVTLLRAVALLKESGRDVHLVLVGEGPTREDLTRLTVELGIEERVSFAGHRPPVPNLQHLFDVSVLASTDEAFPNSLLEGMAAGNPIVATRVGGIPDAVVDGTTGILVPTSNPRAFADALTRLLATPELARRMGDRGRERVRSRFSAEASLTTLTDLYLRLVSSARSRSGDGLSRDAQGDRSSKWRLQRRDHTVSRKP